PPVVGSRDEIDGQAGVWGGQEGLDARRIRASAGDGEREMRARHAIGQPTMRFTEEGPLTRVLADLGRCGFVDLDERAAGRGQIPEGGVEGVRPTEGGGPPG